MTLSLPFATQDQSYPFSYLRMGHNGVYSPGVVLSGDMAVTPASGLQVQIAAGEAYVQQTVARLGSFYASRGLYYIFSDNVGNPYNNISAPISNPRVDMVVARVYDTYEQQLSGASYWRYEWVTGTETAGANITYGSAGYLSGIGAVPDNSLVLAYVLQTVGESSIASANVLINPLMGGWQALTLGTDIKTVASSPIPAARLKGDTVRLRGTPVVESGAGTTLFTLPSSEFYPPYTLYLNLVENRTQAITQFTLSPTTGVFAAASSLTGLDEWTLDGVTYTV